jgi:hypothetical protein
MSQNPLAAADVEGNTEVCAPATRTVFWAWLPAQWQLKYDSQFLLADAGGGT